MKATEEMVAKVVAESDLVKITDIPGSVLYRAEVVCPDGSTIIVPDLRAFTRSIKVHPDGKVDIAIGAKDKRITPHTIRYPYHFLWNRVLCSVKFNIVKVYSSFALNYHLFCEEWDTCLMFCVSNNGPAVFVSGRDEWKKDGVIGSLGQEMNISLRVEMARHVPEPIIRPILGPEFLKWLEDSKALAASKGK